MESFENFCPKNVLMMTLDWPRHLFAFRASSWEEFMDFVEDLGAKANKRC